MDTASGLLVSDHSPEFQDTGKCLLGTPFVFYDEILAYMLSYIKLYMFGSICYNHWQTSRLALQAVCQSKDVNELNLQETGFPAKWATKA